MKYSFVLLVLVCVLVTETYARKSSLSLMKDSAMQFDGVRGIVKDRFEFMDHLAVNMKRSTPDIPTKCLADLANLLAEPTCAAFFEKLVGDGSSKRSDDDDDDDDGSNSLPNLSLEDVSAYCEGNCSTLVTNVVNCINRYEPEDDLEYLQPLLNGILCLKDDAGNYCYPTLYNVSLLFENNDSKFRAAPYHRAVMDKSSSDEKSSDTKSSKDTGSVSSFGNFTTLTEEMLDEICVPCYNKLVDFLYDYKKKNPEFEDDDYYDLAYLEVLCLQDNNTYCAIIVQDFERTCGLEDFDPVCASSKVDTVCETSCLQKVLSTFDAYDDDKDDDDDDNKTVDYFCLQDANGAYCVSEYAKWNTTYSSTCPNNIVQNGCKNEACNAALTDFTNDMGCCAAPMYDLFDDTHPELEDIVKSTCPAIKLPESCPSSYSSYEVTKTMATTYDYDWVVKNRNSFDPSFISDIARTLGITKQDVKIISVSKKSTVSIGRASYMSVTADVQFSIRGRNDAQTQSVSNQYDTLYSNNQIKLVSTDTTYQNGVSQGGFAHTTTAQFGLTFVAFVLGLIMW